jgi:membrane-associated phospholipid phosphatase
VQANHLLGNAATGARLIGSPGAIALPLGVYVAGRALRRPQLAELGAHTLEAVLMSKLVTGVGKSVLGRARPRANPDDPFDYRFGRGLHQEDFSSMPSGHTSAAFAAASAATAEVGAHWPQHRRLVGITLYTAAGLVGLSRMYNNQHWASDVVVGAAVGTFSGWKVVGYTHAHPANPLDRLLLGARAAPAVGGGTALSFTLTTR